MFNLLDLREVARIPNNIGKGLRAGLMAKQAKGDNREMKKADLEAIHDGMRPEDDSVSDAQSELHGSHLERTELVRAIFTLHAGLMDLVDSVGGKTNDLKDYTEREVFNSIQKLDLLVLEASEAIAKVKAALTENEELIVDQDALVDEEVTPVDEYFIDAGISHEVLMLNRWGIETFESCDASPGHCFSEPTIRFSGGVGEGAKAFAVAMESGLKPYAIRRAWDVIDNELVGPKWEMTFHPSQLKNPPKTGKA